MRSLGLWRAVVRRVRADRPVVLAAALLLLCATTLVAAAVLYGDTIATGSLRRALAEAQPADRAIAVRTTVARAEAAPVEALIADELARTLGPSGGTVSHITWSGPFEKAAGATTGTATQSGGDITLFAAHDDLGGHATLLDGRWANAGSDPIEATLSEGAASALGVAVGDRVVLADRLDPARSVTVDVTGTWRPAPDDPYWIGSTLELDGMARSGSFTTRGPFVVAPADLERVVTGPRRDVEWRAIPDVAALAVGNVDAIQADIASLRARLHAAVQPTRDIAVTMGLADLLGTVSRAIVAARSGILLLTIQFGVLSLYAVLLVAGMLVERRRPGAALLRSRGASSIHLSAMAATEGLILAVPAAVLAPFLALGAVRALGAVGPLAGTGIADAATITPATIGASIAMALACVVAFTLPTVASATSPAGARAARGRQLARTLPQRLGLDLVLLVLAAIAIWQLRLYGSPLTRDARGTLGVDPLLVLAPAVGLVAGGLLAIRFLPRIAELGERALRNDRGIVGPTGARQLARRPLRSTRSALLVLLAIALFTFAAAYAGTWTRSQADQAAYAAAADMRVTWSEYAPLPAWAAGSALRAIPGVTTAMPVTRQTLDVGKAVRGGQVLGVDPATAAAIMAMPDGAEGAALRDALAALPEAGATAGMALPDLAARIRVTVDADLAAVGPEESQPGFTNSPASALVSVVLRDADGRTVQPAPISVELVGDGQVVDIPLTAAVDGTTATPAGPLELIALELTVGPPTVGTVTGTIEATAVASSPDASGDGWAPLALPTAADGWAWTRAGGPEGIRPYTPPADAPGRIVIGSGPGATSPVEGAVFPPMLAQVFRLAPVVDEPRPIAAIASGGLLRASGAAVGDVVAATSSGLPVTLRIVGSTETFAPLDPAVPFVVVDGAALERVRFQAIGQAVAPQEWWLALDGGATGAAGSGGSPGSAGTPSEVAAVSGAVAAAVRADPIAAADVVARDDLSRALSGDPVALGILGALGLGALAALGIAAIGFLVSTSVSTSERIGEIALLRALGLAPAQAVRWLALESAFLLSFALVAGLGLGLLLAWLILPFATVTATGTPPVPAPVVVVPAEAILPLVALAGVLLFVTILLVARQVTRMTVAGVLRTTEA
jgi:hypothetical protein